MDKDQYDVIVIGAGLAGLCCAGEFVMQGKRPLLIAETKEVGDSFRSKWVDGNRGMVQHPLLQTQWGGGWWYDLVRRMNVPVRMYMSPTIELSMAGSGTFMDMPYCLTPSSLVDFLIEMAPLPLEEIRKPFTKMAEEAYAIPYRELLAMHSVPFGEWLDERNADEVTRMIILTLLAALHFVSPEEARQLSVLGAWGTMRAWVSGEAQVVVIEPDTQEGLCVPIAKEVEQRGGAVWKGRKVDHILIEGDVACGVVLEDGTEVRAPAVAIATGLPRVEKLFESVPPEVEVPTIYATEHNTNRSFFSYTLLGQPVVPEQRRRMTTIINPDMSVLQWQVPIHMFPWTTEPGKHFVASIRNYPAREVADVPEETILAEMDDVCEELYPGFAAAKEAVGIHRIRQGWSVSPAAGPKLPRRSGTYRNLWYVGEGSVPLGGMWTDGAASTGILGARDVLSAG